jgi:hypothetical protein
MLHLSLISVHETTYAFIFLRKGKVLKESERHIITAEGTIRKLVIKKATLEDQSDYTCVAVNVKTSSKLKVESK